MKIKDYNAQLKAMLAKNGKLHIRHIGGTICEVLLPLILMGVSSLMVYVYLAMADTISGFDSGYSKKAQESRLSSHKHKYFHTSFL